MQLAFDLGLLVFRLVELRDLSLEHRYLLLDIGGHCFNVLLLQVVFFLLERVFEVHRRCDLALGSFLLTYLKAEEPDQVLNVIDLLPNVEFVLRVLGHLAHKMVVFFLDFVEKIRALVQVLGQTFLDDLRLCVDLSDAVELHVVLAASLGLSLVDLADDLLHF